MKMIAIKIAYMFFVGMLLMLVVVGTLVFADRYMDINLGGVFYFGPVVLFFLFSMLSNTGFSKKVSVVCKKLYLPVRLGLMLLASFVCIAYGVLHVYAYKDYLLLFFSFAVSIIVAVVEVCGFYSKWWLVPYEDLFEKPVPV